MATLDAPARGSTSASTSAAGAAAAQNAASSSSSAPLASLTPLLPSLAHNSRVSAELLARLRPLAVKEAARRERESKGAAAGKDANVEAGGEEGNGQGSADEEMLALLEEARERNEAEWGRIRAVLVELGEAEPVESDAAREGEGEEEEGLRAKEVELQRLDHELAALEADLSALPPAQSHLAQSLDTRAALLESVRQYDLALETLRREGEEEGSGRDSDRKLLADLGDVLQGLKRRREIEELREGEVGAEEVAASLKSKLALVESDLGLLLNALISTSNRLFSDESARSRAQLRALLDSLMNSAWDTPADPYVDVRKYPAAIAAFLVRANVAVEHAGDARRLRLVQFQKGVGGTQ